MWRKPGASLPAACKGWDETFGAYRFFNNGKVTEQKVLSSHIDATRKRIAEHKVALCIQDTTEMDFTGRKLCDLSEQLPGTMLVSISDREGDIYECFVEAVRMEGRRRAEYIIRGCQDRNLPEKLEDGCYKKLMEDVSIYFKVLKSGCKIEDRQLETSERIKPCIVIVAWRVLFVTMLPCLDRNARICHVRFFSRMMNGNLYTCPRENGD